MHRTLKAKALAAAAIAVLITIGSWFVINQATERGLVRLESIDKVKTECDSAYAAARNRNDTTAVDERALSILIDSGSSSAPRHCRDLRQVSETQSARDSAKRVEALRQMMPSRERRSR